jgi:hypothetical protein
MNDENKSSLGAAFREAAQAARDRQPNPLALPGEGAPIRRRQGETWREFFLRRRAEQPNPLNVNRGNER